MAKKITQYPASSGNPDLQSVIDVSEYSGGTFISKKLTIQQLLSYLTLNLDLGVEQTLYNSSGSTILAGTPVEIDSQTSSLPNVRLLTGSSNDGLSKIYVAKNDILNGTSGAFIESGIIEFNTSTYTSGQKLFWNVSTQTFTTSTTLEDQLFLGVVLTVSSTGKIFVSPTRSPELVKGANNQVALFTNSRKVTGSSKFTFIDNVGTEVGFTFDDGANNVTKVGVTYINVESEGLASNSVLRLANWADNSNKGAVSFRKSRGSKAVPTKVLTNDVLGTLLFAGQSDKTVNGGSPTSSGMTTAEIIVKALNNFSKNYDTTTLQTIAQGLTELSIWLQGSNQTGSGDNTPLNTKVFTVNGDGKITLKNYDLPLADGLNGQALVTNGAGVTSWGSPTAQPAELFQTIGRNSTGSTLRKGTIVYILGSTGNRPNFVKAQANSEATSAGTFGVIVSDIPNNSDGYASTIGTISGLDTRAVATFPFTNDTLVDGDTIYLSPTVAGYVTNIKPSAPNHLVYIGKVVITSPTNGTIVYRIQNGYEIEELHNVAITSPIDGQVLTYDAPTNLWKNESLTSPTQIELDPVINVLNTPPTTPTDGDRYRIGTAPTGAWVGRTHQIAERSGSIWIYTVPVVDNLVFQTSTATTFRYSGTTWNQWAGTPILQNGNSLGGIMRIGTNDNFNVFIKRNNVDIFVISQNMFSMRGAGGFYGTFNLSSVVAFQNWNMPNKSGTVALLSDIPSAPTLPILLPSEIRRGVVAVAGSTTQGTFGALTPINDGSILAVAMSSTMPYPRFRILSSVQATNATAGISFGNAGNTCRIGAGFRFIGIYVNSDVSSGGTQWFVPNARHFCGLTATPTPLAISSTIAVGSLTNVIGVGSDVGDANLQLFFQDGVNTGSNKIDLGSNFPANKTSAVANNEAYKLELFNEFGSNDVYYEVTRVNTGFKVSGTLTNELPVGVFLNPQIIRTSGSTSQGVSLDVVQLVTYTKN